MDKTIISKHLYNDDNSQAINFVENISDEESLFTYAYNFNWDNGFDVPYAILKNKHCTLSIALMIFDAAEGFSFLLNQENNEISLPEWPNFIRNLHRRILNNEFSNGITSYNPRLSKLQLLKISKKLSDTERIFITPIEGKDCYIDL